GRDPDVGRAGAQRGGVSPAGTAAGQEQHGHGRQRKGESAGNDDRSPQIPRTRHWIMMSAGDGYGKMTLRTGRGRRGAWRHAGRRCEEERSRSSGSDPMQDEWSQAVDTRSHAADRLAEAARSGKPCEPVRDLIGTAGEAYAVQEIGTRRALSEGRRLVGRKVGMTNPAAREKFGIDQPDYGMLFADMSYLDGLPIPIDRFLQPKVEAEIAFVMGADLTGGPFTVAEVIRAVDFVLPAIEIADSRI